MMLSSGVKLTMEAVCIMFSIKPVRKNDPNKLGAKMDDYWESAQKELLQVTTDGRADDLFMRRLAGPEEATGVADALRQREHS